MVGAADSRERVVAATSGAGPDARPHTPAVASDPQRQMWLAEALDARGAAYNVVVAFNLRGPLDVGALSAALDDLVARHEALRTSLRVVDGELLQIVEPAPAGVLEMVEATEGDDDSWSRAVDEALARAARNPFDLSRGRLLRAKLLRGRTDAHLLLLTTHHVAVDARSLDLLLTELGEAYAAQQDGGHGLPVARRTTYRDAWERLSERASKSAREDLEYWRAHLAEIPQRTRVEDAARAGGTVCELAGSVRCTLPADVVAGLNSVAGAEDATWFDVLAAAVTQVLTNRGKNGDDVAIATSVDLRGRETEFADVVGNLSNTVIVRTRAAGDLLEGVRLARQARATATAHAGTSFETLASVFAPTRGGARTRLFDVFCGATSRALTLHLADLEVTPVPAPAGAAKFDLSFGLHSTGSGAVLDCTYSVDVHDDGEAHAMLAAVESLLTHAAQSEQDEDLLGRILAVWSEVLELDEIGVDDDFFMLGGDSFGAVRAMFAIEAEMPVVQLFRTPTPRSLAQAISEDAVAREAADSILLLLTPPDRPAGLNLVCTPYGAGNAVAYQALADALPEDVALWAVNLPGRDPQSVDLAQLTIDDAAERTVRAVLSKVDGPLAVYGHCAGTSLALEIARRLEDSLLDLRHVFVAASLPHPDPEQSLLDERSTTDEEWIGFLRSIGGLDGHLSAEGAAALMRAGRNDHVEAMRHQIASFASPPHRLRAPIHTIFGELDQGTPDFPVRHQEWAVFGTVDGYSVIERGGHYFVGDQAREVADIVYASWVAGT